MPTRYQYSPLEDQQSIRLLHISRLNATSLVFDFSHMNLDDVQYFEAVSYTWGSTVREKTIQHRTSGAVLYVTRNCEAALWNLVAEGPRTLWIDALCINQDDVGERSRQVRLMGQIYRSAPQTIAYIGESDKDSYNLSLWCRSEELDQSGAWTPEYDDSVQYPVVEWRDYSLYKAKKRACRLLGRPWFYRTWIIQETILSQRLTIQAGNDKISWLAFRRLTPGEGGVLHVKAAFSEKNTEKTAETPKAPRQKGVSLRYNDSCESLWQTVEDRPSFSTLLSSECLIDFGHLFDMMCETSTYGCEDPRDRLYAILSLFQGQIPASLEPDYSQTVAEVYTNISRFVICYGVAKSLSAARGVAGDNSLPSWAVDWRVARQDNFRPEDVTAWYRADEQSHAGFMIGDRKMRVSPLGDQGLSIRGRYVKGFLKVEQLPSLRSSLHFFPGKDIAWLKRIAGADNYNQRISVVRMGDTVGLVPLGTTAGDVTCVFLGVRVPFILRPTAKGWQLVGECFIPWVMEGQAVADIEWNTAYSDQPVAPLEDFNIY